MAEKQNTIQYKRRRSSNGMATSAEITASQKESVDGRGKGQNYFSGRCGGIILPKKLDMQLS